MSAFLTSQERQAIILHLLHSLRADKGDTVGKLKFRDGEAISKYMYSEGIFRKLSIFNTPNFSVSRSLSAKVLYQVFPVHQRSHLQKLQKCWVQRVLDRQPIGNISECDFDQVCFSTTNVCFRRDLQLLWSSNRFVFCLVRPLHHCIVHSCHCWTLILGT